MDYTQVNDEELVALSLQGDDDAFGHLYVRYNDPVKGLIYPILRNQEDTDDCCHDVFIRLKKKLNNYQKGRTVKPWLLQIAKNTALNLLKKQEREKRKRQESPTPHILLPEDESAPEKEQMTSWCEVIFPRYHAHFRSENSIRNFELMALRDYLQGFKIREIQESLEKIKPPEIRSKIDVENWISHRRALINMVEFLVDEYYRNDEIALMKDILEDLFFDKILEPQEEQVAKLYFLNQKPIEAIAVSINVSREDALWLYRQSRQKIIDILVNRMARIVRALHLETRRSKALNEQ